MKARHVRDVALTLFSLLVLSRPSANAASASAESPAFALDLRTRASSAPLILVQPVGGTFLEGTEVSLSTAVYAEPAATLRWQRRLSGSSQWNDFIDSTSIQGSATETLRLLQAAIDLDGALLRCVATNDSGSTMTAEVWLIIDPATSPAVVIQQPADASVLVGAMAAFTISAEGNPAPTYQWQRRPSPENIHEPPLFKNLADSATISGSQTPTLSISNTTLAKSGESFRCVVSNTAGTENSDAATLTVSVPPSVAPEFTLQPVDVTTPSARVVEFVVAVTGYPVPTVRWQVRQPGSGAWSDLADGGAYSGVSSARLSVTTSVSMSGHRFRGIATNSLGSAISSEAWLTIDESIIPVTILQQPTSASVAEGASAQFIVSATSSPSPTFQWQRKPAGESTWTSLAEDGTYSGTATNTLAVTGSIASMTGDQFRAVVTNPGGSVTTEVVTLWVGQHSRLLNLSTRAVSLTGDNVLIPGFVLGGNGTKRLLIRGVGPTLADFGVSGVLEDPLLTLKRTEGGSTTDVAGNDDWETNANLADLIDATRDVGAFELAPGSADAALLVDLEPGQYSVVAEGAAGGTGVAIVELYDASTSSTGSGQVSASSLLNISTRGFVGTGDQVMIPGFVISNEGPKTLLIRAVGPTLADFGVTGTLANPKLAVNRTEENGTSTPLLTQDDWGVSPDAGTTAAIAAQVGAFPLAEGSADAAFVITLQPGIYSVVASAANGTDTGVALVEVYVVE